MAALILGLLTRGTDGFAPAVLEQLGRTASMAAAITVRRPGANPPTWKNSNLVAARVIAGAARPYWLERHVCLLS